MKFTWSCMVTTDVCNI